MGGCASKPKDLDTKEAPAPESTPVDQTVQADAVPQENKDGDETTKEEPSVDVSEPAPAPESEKTEETPAAEAVDEEPPKAEDAAPESGDTPVVIKV